jgi:hypothetical protein
MYCIHRLNFCLVYLFLVRITNPPHPIESLLLLLQSIGNLLLLLYDWPFVGLHYYLTSHVRNTTYEKCMSRERTMTTLAWQPQNHHHHAHSLLQQYELAGCNSSTSTGMPETGIHIDIYIHLSAVMLITWYPLAILHVWNPWYLQEAGPENFILHEHPLEH